MSVVESPLKALRAAAARLVQGVGASGDAFVVEPVSDVLGASDVTLDEARGLPGVGRAARLLAGVASQVPLYAVRNTDTPNVAERVFPTPPILRNADPAGANPGPGWRWAVVDSLFWWGNTVGWAGDVDPVTLRPRRLPLWRTDQVWWDSRGGVWRVGSEVFAPSEVWHVKVHAPAGDRLGRGVLADYQTELKLIRAAEQAQFVILNHGVPTGLLKVDASSGLTEEDLRGYKRKWLESQRRRTVSIMKGIEFQRVSFNAEELTMIPTREFNLRLASDISGVPPYMLGVPSESRVYANAETEWANFIRTTLGTYLTPVQFALSECLPSHGMWDQQALFDLSVLEKADSKTRWEIHRIAHEMGAKTLDEIRNEENLGPLEGDGGSDERTVAEMVQKLYLGVGSIISPDEGRGVLRSAGMDLADGVPPEAVSKIPKPEVSA